MTNRALLVGINAYPGQPLNGCVDDVNDMAGFLVDSCGFATGDIRLLVDDRATTDNIKERLLWLVAGTTAGDRLLFHYSGHGTIFPFRDATGDVASQHASICPVDFDWTREHALIDDDLRQIFDQVAANTDFIFVSDSCNSGDLTRALRMRPRFLAPPADIRWRLRTAIDKRLPVLPLVHDRCALISGCRADQESADANFDGRYNGALTYYLLRALKGPNGHTMPLSQLVQAAGSLLAANSYNQEPQLRGPDEITAKSFLDGDGSVSNSRPGQSTAVQSPPIQSVAMQSMPVQLIAGGTQAARDAITSAAVRLVELVEDAAGRGRGRGRAALPAFDGGTVAKCVDARLSDAADIEALFDAEGGFFAWYNKTLSGTAAFSHRGRARDNTEIRGHFTSFWDHLADTFGIKPITFVEFCALMSVNIEETTGDLTSAPEEVNGMHHPHPGLAYAFDKISGLKQSYNDSTDGSNKSALELFEDDDFVAAHKMLPGAPRVLNRPGGIDPAWGGNTWPEGFDATPDESVNGFVMQADFFKFRGRGVIQTTWRSDYREVLKFILSADLSSQPDLLAVQQRWEAASGSRSGTKELEYILTISRTDEWDKLFLNPLILAQGVHIDSMQKGNYLKLRHDVDGLSAGRSVNGSLLHMASRINGGDYPARVVPMMKTMMCGVASLLPHSRVITRRRPRMIEYA